MSSTMKGKRMARKNTPPSHVSGEPLPSFSTKSHYDGSFAKCDLRNGR